MPTSSTSSLNNHAWATVGAVVSILLLQISSADASGAGSGECWKTEFNPLTQETFESKSSWQATLNDWHSKNPGLPNPIHLLQGLKVSEQARRELPSGISDKAMHCHVGCRISASVSIRTARYAGWYKELLDITDCKAATHFEPADFDATSEGAKLASQGVRGSQCLKECALKNPIGN